MHSVRSFPFALLLLGSAGLPAQSRPATQSSGLAAEYAALAKRAAEAALGDTGRILLRPSGTEQLVRVMVEAADEDTARMVAFRVAESVSDQP